MTRLEQVRLYGLEFVEHCEQVWLERGYAINYKTGLLEKVR